MIYGPGVRSLVGAFWEVSLTLGSRGALSNPEIRRTQFRSTSEMHVTDFGESYEMSTLSQDLGIPQI